jgi:anti-sigma factor (TIGR02949 family)
LYEIDCERVLRLLETYCDGELPPAQAALVARHLDRCTGCLDRRDFRVRYQAIIRQKCGSAECPDSLLTRIRGLLASSA